VAARVISPARRVRGEVAVPGDKSISHRALVLAALAEGLSTIRGRAGGADQDSMVECLRQLGVEIANRGDSAVVRGVGLRGLRAPRGDLDCGNSGATMRFLAGALSATPDVRARLVGDASLSARPMARVATPLAILGAAVRTSPGGTPPLEVFGERLRGAVVATEVPSAQVKTALLLAALQAEGVTAVIEPARTRDHTERLLRRLGVDVRVGEAITLNPPARMVGFELDVPGDPSAAGFWAILGCVHPDAEVVVRDVCLNPTRTGFLEVLRRMGADITVGGEQEESGEPVGDLLCRSGPLSATEVHPWEIPSLVDEVPVLALAASQASGTTRFHGLGELRHKEVDRVAAVARQLGALGADVVVDGDDLLVTGPVQLVGAPVSSLGDHRMAMTLALAGLMATGATPLDDAEAARVSYPAFFDELTQLTSD
jgi:3-phosphoshikimate 1-carboxyvinyltransferase